MMTQILLTNSCGWGNGEGFSERRGNARQMRLGQFNESVAEHTQARAEDQVKTQVTGG